MCNRPFQQTYAAGVRLIQALSGLVTGDVSRPGRVPHAGRRQCFVRQRASAHLIHKDKYRGSDTLPARSAPASNHFFARFFGADFRASGTGGELGRGSIGSKNLMFFPTRS